MTDDLWDMPVVYYDNGVKFGTGFEMIEEIKLLRSKYAQAICRIQVLEDIQRNTDSALKHEFTRAQRLQQKYDPFYSAAMIKA